MWEVKRYIFQGLILSWGIYCPTPKVECKIACDVIGYQTKTFSCNPNTKQFEYDGKTIEQVENVACNDPCAKCGIINIFYIIETVLRLRVPLFNKFWTHKIPHYTFKCVCYVFITVNFVFTNEFWTSLFLFFIHFPEIWYYSR